jgi:hypothetical protein
MRKLPDRRENDDVCRPRTLPGARLGRTFVLLGHCNLWSGGCCRNFEILQPPCQRSSSIPASTSTPLRLFSRCGTASPSSKIFPVSSEVRARVLRSKSANHSSGQGGLQQSFAVVLAIAIELIMESAQVGLAGKHRIECEDAANMSSRVGLIVQHGR